MCIHIATFCVGLCDKIHNSAPVFYPTRFQIAKSSLAWLGLKCYALMYCIQLQLQPVSMIHVHVYIILYRWFENSKSYNLCTFYVMIILCVIHIQIYTTNGPIDGSGMLFRPLECPRQSENDAGILTHSEISIDIVQGSAFFRSAWTH